MCGVRGLCIIRDEMLDCKCLPTNPPQKVTFVRDLFCFIRGMWRGHVRRVCFAVGLSMHLSLYDFRVCVHNSDILSQSFLCSPSHYRSHVVGIPKLPEYFWVHFLCPGVSGISGIARCAYSRMRKYAQWVFSGTHVHRNTVESLGLPAGNIRGCMLGWYA